MNRCAEFVGWEIVGVCWMGKRQLALYKCDAMADGSSPPLSLRVAFRAVLSYLGEWPRGTATSYQETPACTTDL